MVVFGLLAASFAKAAAVKGLYVGSDFYTPSESTQNAARSSGFDRLFLSFFHIDDHGDITYNRTPVVQNGVYVGDASWGAKLAALKQQPTAIGRIELVIGGPNDASFSNIKRLINSSGILQKNLKALKNALRVDAIQLADEQTYDVPSTVAFGRMIAELGLKVTLAPSTHQSYWTDVNSELATNIDAVYLQCFGKGVENDLGSWIKALGGSRVYPGLWGNTDTPISAMLKMRHWHQTEKISGGFMWLNGFMPEDAVKWSGVLACGMDDMASLRIVNKNSGKFMSLPDSHMTNGSVISQSAFENGSNQRWMLMPTEDGNHFKIVSWASGQCASITYSSSLIGSQLWTWDYNRDPSQQFDLVDAGGGWFKIRNVRSGLVLEVAGGNTADKGVVQQNIDENALNQLWRFYAYNNSLLAGENFDYPPGKLAGQNGGIGWNGGWQNQFDSNLKTMVETQAIEDFTDEGNTVRLKENAASILNGSRVGRYLDCSVGGNFSVYGYLDSHGRIGADGTRLYVSFFQQPAKTSLFYEFELNRESLRIAGIGNDTSSNNVNLRTSAKIFTPIAPGNTNVNFYIMRIDFKTGGDEVRVYSNPKSRTEPESPTLIKVDAGDMSFNRISLAAYANNDAVKFARIRVASSWRDAIATRVENEVRPSTGIIADDLFRQVKISAQVLSGRMEKYYLLDGDRGLQVLFNQPMEFEPGDSIVVEGMVERARGFVRLIEADAIKKGHAPLPRPQALSRSDPNSQNQWVWIEGVLTSLQDDATGQTMEIQNGSQKYTARFQSVIRVPADWSVGSRLRLMGIHVRSVGDSLAPGNQNSFDVLLGSPTAVEVIAGPPWWTPRRAKLAVGILIMILGLAFAWIRLLHRQVNVQTARLRREITQREQAEHAQLIEEERSRISRDLHDDLGGVLTQINMLSRITSGMKLSPDLMADRIQQISDKSHRLISALDEVVWMMNSKDESLSSLAAYLAAYTEEFLSKTDIVCRVETPQFYPNKFVTADMRNNIFSSVKEAVNNAVRHGKPARLWLRLSVSEKFLEIQVRDDGCGFHPFLAEKGNGLANLKLRMQKLGGICELQSNLNVGTTVTLQVPLV